LRDIAQSLRVLSGRERPEEGVVAQEPVRTFTEPQRGVQWLTEPYVAPETEWEAYKAYVASLEPTGVRPAPYKWWREDRQARRLQETGEVSPRLVEKLLNPEGH
jgi:hypothetical protein